MKTNPLGTASRINELEDEIGNIRPPCIRNHSTNHPHVSQANSLHLDCQGVQKHHRTHHMPGELGRGYVRELTHPLSLNRNWDPLLDSTVKGEVEKLVLQDRQAVQGRYPGATGAGGRWIGALATGRDDNLSTDDGKERSSPPEPIAQLWVSYK